MENFVAHGRSHHLRRVMLLKTHRYATFTAPSPLNVTTPRLAALSDNRSNPIPPPCFDEMRQHYFAALLCSVDHHLQTLAVANDKSESQSGYANTAYRAGRTFAMATAATVINLVVTEQTSWT